MKANNEKKRKEKNKEEKKKEKKEKGKAGTTCKPSKSSKPRDAPYDLGLLGPKT